MYKAGKWKAICDQCGFEFYNDELRKRWDGLMVCHADWEPDHPQKFLRVREDSTSVPWSRPEPPDVFVDLCYIYARQAYADMGEADCLAADNTSISYARCVELKGRT